MRSGTKRKQELRTVHRDVPLGAREQLVKGDDLGFVEVASVQLKRAMFGRVYAAILAGELPEIPDYEERTRPHEPRHLPSLHAGLVAFGKLITNELASLMDRLLHLSDAA
ncbi:MAG: hypothetical protein JWO14_152 [Solirubrobacterales bacterium]|nr:hypothetical protein [Solirubrobacterales bacterium]